MHTEVAITLPNAVLRKDIGLARNHGKYTLK
jgi:hypothetical protein